VKKTVRARKGSNKESAAIAICTKTVLHKRGRTLKSYSRKRLITQKKFRGGLKIPGVPQPQPNNQNPMTPGQAKMVSDLKLEEWKKRREAEKMSQSKDLKDNLNYSESENEYHQILNARMKDWETKNPKPSL
jgi:hypothetical protein